MAEAEQLVYTTANIRGRKGYQIVAKSRGVTNEIASALRPHFHPPGIRPDCFKESHALVELAGGRVAYCHAKNIGAGHDGRRDTVCSHVLVLEREGFARLGCDTRVLATLHPGRRRVRGRIPAVKLDPLRRPPAADAKDLGAVLRGVLWLLLSGERAAVESDDPTAAPRLLSLLPPSARLVQFSSVSVDADRQRDYRLVCYPRGKRPRPSSGFKVVAPGSAPRCDGDGALWRAVDHYAGAALNGNARHLESIQDRFEAVPSLSGRDRMVLACAYERFTNGAGESLKRECAEDAFSAISKLDSPAFSSYFDTIKDYVGPYRRASDMFGSDPQRSADLFTAWRSSFPLEIGASIFLAFLKSFSSGGAVGGTRGAGRCEPRQAGPLAGAQGAAAGGGHAEERAGKRPEC